jgi:hypothetical protein
VSNPSDYDRRKKVHVDEGDNIVVVDVKRTRVPRYVDYDPDTEPSFSVSGADVDLGTITITPKNPTAGIAYGSAELEGVYIYIVGIGLIGYTDEFGDWEWDCISPGTYIASAEKDGYYFTPETIELIATAGGTLSGKNFTPVAVTVSGTVLDILDAPVENVTVAMTDEDDTLTDELGEYSFAPVIDGVKTITPTKGGWTFEPEYQEVEVNRSSIPDIDFTAISAIPVEGLVGYWTLLSGSAADTSGKEHHGSITGDLNADITDPLGNVTSAHNFDGTNDYVTILDHDDFDFGTGTFSMSMWISCIGSSGIGARTPICKNRPSTQSPSGQYCWAFSWYLTEAGSGTEYAAFEQDATYPVQSPGGTGDMLIGGVGTAVWHHLCIVRTASKMYIYFDNVKYEVTFTSASLSNNKTVCIGGESVGYVIKWRGGICHMRIHKAYAFTDQDVQAIFVAKT